MTKQLVDKLSELSRTVTRLRNALQSPSKAGIFEHTRNAYELAKWFRKNTELAGHVDINYMRVLADGMLEREIRIIAEVHADIANIVLEDLKGILSMSGIQVVSPDVYGLIRIGGYSVSPKADENAKLLKKWKRLVNMSASQLKAFLETDEGKEAGLSRKEAAEQGISSGHDSAEAIIRMKSKPVSKWTHGDWKWCKKQVNFITRMRGNEGPLHDEDGNKTRKHTSLLLWGHNPK